MALLGLFKSKQQRELEAKLRINQSKAKIQRFINHAKSVQKRYWDLGKQALGLDDRPLFAQLSAAFLRTRELARHWERYLLQLETLCVRREEVAATGEFIRGVSAATKSILAGATPKEIAALQVNMEQALAKAETLEELLSVAMETTADHVFGTDQLDEQKLEELAAQAKTETAGEGKGAVDDRIVQELKRIEEEMRKELER
jgi:hypothetical protein